MTQVIQRHQQPISPISDPRKISLTPSCEGKTDLFFSESTIDMRTAQLICSSCPCREPCTERARQRPPFAGVWGGIIFVNGDELLTKRGRGRPRKSEQLDNARTLKALEQSEVIGESDEDDDSDQGLARQIA